jgi:hypothetical protein
MFPTLKDTFGLVLATHPITNTPIAFDEGSRQFLETFNLPSQGSDVWIVLWRDLASAASSQHTNFDGPSCVWACSVPAHGVIEFGLHAG